MNDLAHRFAVGTQVPFDIGTADNTPRWREQFAWPLAHGTARDALVKQFHAFLDAVAETKDEFWRRALLATGMALQSELRTNSQAALWVDAEAKTGIALAGGPAILDFLRNGSGKPPETQITLSRAQKAVARDRWLRRVARTASWTPYWKLPRALLAPEVVVISQHNQLLIEAARRDLRRINFRYSDIWLNRIVAGSKRPAPVPPADLVAFVVGKLIAALPIANDALLGRLSDILSRSVEAHLRKVAADLVGLENAKSLPSELWSGSGGFYPSRVIGLEVMRRGGFVKRFDHGGATGFFTAGDEIAFSELAVCNTYHTATEAIARLVDGSEAARSARRINKSVTVEGGSGDRTFSKRKLSPMASKVSRPRVMYAPSTLLGFRQLYPPSLPDPVYLDWQCRLAEALRDLPIDFTCKPHPEGIMRGRPHPLEAIAPTTRKRFDKVMGSADVFVFDYPMTTAFYEAMTSDRVVVYIDLGISPMNPGVEKDIRSRCRVIAAR